ncbi:hypothetical protein [Planococcus sp. ISL-110]|uniref:hypothetical protein n=1 Tax=Planococcus sp. ISL-110 TaxID=2819167 RepID=UPI001BEAB825|nr:hypothetical protein [Planococcus sp. ISL-110]MBT2569335.1 hypothetical protein [Planococcus sp. ISL-110]
MLDTDTAFKLDNAQFISLTKIIEENALGYIKTNSETYKVIKKTLFEIMFKKENIKLMNEIDKNKKLKSIIFKLKKKKLVRHKSTKKLFYFFT